MTFVGRAGCQSPCICSLKSEQLGAVTRMCGQSRRTRAVLREDMPRPTNNAASGVTASGGEAFSCQLFWMNAKHPVGLPPTGHIHFRVDMKLDHRHGDQQ
jgi:hypothetical protein